MTIGELALWEKTGGRSGTYRRAPNLDDDLDARPLTARAIFVPLTSRFPARRR